MRRSWTSIATSPRGTAAVGAGAPTCLNTVIDLYLPIAIPLQKIADLLHLTTGLREHRAWDRLGRYWESAWGQGLRPTPATTIDSFGVANVITGAVGLVS